MNPSSQHRRRPKRRLRPLPRTHPTRRQNPAPKRDPRPHRKTPATQVFSVCSRSLALRWSHCHPATTRRVRILRLERKTLHRSADGGPRPSPGPGESPRTVVAVDAGGWPAVVVAAHLAATEGRAQAVVVVARARDPRLVLRSRRHRRERSASTTSSPWASSRMRCRSRLPKSSASSWKWT